MEPRRTSVALFRLSGAALLAAALAWAQFRASGLAALSARLEVATSPLMPARVYLFKDGRPFRLSPTDAMLPLRVDLFYRERLWRRAPDPAVLEVTCNDISHFILLKGKAGFDLPAGRYRIEAYRGLFYKPFSRDFKLQAGQTLKLQLPMEDWTGGERRHWLSGDTHIHLVRAPQDDPVFLAWLEAEDLSVANFLQLQRQMDAAVQYGFGPGAEARLPGRSIRSGHESRSEFFGHVLLLGGRQIIRPLSVGTMYANSAETFPYPFVLFGLGRRLGALTGYAHFDGSMKHSTLPLDVALGSIDFVEVFQFGRLRQQEWYQWLNAGFRLTGAAGSDFPVSLNNFTRKAHWSRYLPLLGPERTLVRARAGASAYQAWAEGVRRGEIVVSNGPLLEIAVNEATAAVTARAKFFRPLERLEIIVNGEPIAATTQAQAELSLSARIPATRPLWLAARTQAAPDAEDAPAIQAHTNPVYLGWDGSAPVAAARKSLIERWENQIIAYEGAALRFSNDEYKKRFFERARLALERLRR